MRLITWNCKGAFRLKHDFVAALCPDILVVPECERVSGVTQVFNSAPIKSLEWFGSNPNKGLAAIAYGDYALEVHPNYDPRFRWIVPLSVSGPVAFVLFAVWTLPSGGYGGRWVRPLLEAFDFYASTINTSRVIWAGDFNSNFVWDTPSRRYKFCDFVSLLGQRGLHSLYHRQRQCEHGNEEDHTFYFHHNAERGYHIDYVFATEELHPGGINVLVGSHAEWSRRSDHVPLICDFLGHPPSFNRAFQPTAGQSSVSPSQHISVETVMEFACAENRVCPQPQRWNELWQMLPEKERVGVGWSPSLPLILAAWWETSDAEKQERFLSHIRYAAERGALDLVHRFLTSLSHGQWHYRT